MSLDNPGSRIAFEKLGDGYAVYTDTWFSILLFIQFLLVENGISLIHAAAVADSSGRVTLLPGAGGVGKTAILGRMVKHHGYRVLGDDIVGLSKRGECLSLPRSFILKEYHRTVYPEVFRRLSMELQVKAATSLLTKLVLQNAPFLGIVKDILRRLDLLNKVGQRLSTLQTRDFLAAVPVEDVFGPGAVAERGSIDRIVFLQRYAGSGFRTESMSEEALHRRMIAGIHYELSEIMRQLFAMGALEIVDVPLYFQRVSSIIRSAISGRRCAMLRIPDNASADALSDYFLEFMS